MNESNQLTFNMNKQQQERIAAQLAASINSLGSFFSYLEKQERRLVGVNMEGLKVGMRKYEA